MPQAGLRGAQHLNVSLFPFYPVPFLAGIHRGQGWVHILMAFPLPVHQNMGLPFSASQTRRGNSSCESGTHHSSSWTSPTDGQTDRRMDGWTAFLRSAVMCKHCREHRQVRCCAGSCFQTPARACTATILAINLTPRK